MPRALRITVNELLRALRRLGWHEVVQRGSHVQLEHPDRPGKVTVPMHTGETLDPKLLRSVLRQAGITVEQLRSVLLEEETKPMELTYLIILEPGDESGCD